MPGRAGTNKFARARTLGVGMTFRALALAALLLGLAAAPAAAVTGPLSEEVEREHAPLFDVRVKDAGTPSVPAAVRAARGRMLRSLGEEGVLSVDRATGAVRWLGRTDGYLTGPRKGKAGDAALAWARANLDVLGLTETDLTRLRLADVYRAPNGVTRLIFQQTFGGIPAFDSTLRVNIARDGRILNAGGRPRTGIRVPSVIPRLTAAQGVIAAAGAAGAKAVPKLQIKGIRRGARRETTFAGGHSARLTLVAMDERRTALAWRVWFEESHRAAWSILVDANSGKLIRRANQVKFAAKGLAYDYYPGAPRGGEQREVDFSRWLTEPAKLRGNFTHVYNDADSTEDCTHGADDESCVQDSSPLSANGDFVAPHEEITPQGVTEGDWLYPFTPVPSPLGFCPAAGCAWNHAVNFSWVPNRSQDGTQVFFLVNTFAEHLKASPISFDERANFQFENTTGAGKGGDGIFASSMDAAGQLAGRPAPLLYSDNANMLTRPDGRPPRMQMFLFEPIQAGPLLDFPFSDVSGGTDSTVVYHEFVHGLSNRLVIDAEGEGALNAIQSGSMGEAWSDFYAMDFLMQQGLVEDTNAPGEIKVGIYVDGGQDLVRTEAIDCRPGDAADKCPRKRGVTPEGGGYTYEEFGKIIPGGAEVHADGEIWAQTLMDMRRRLTKEHGDAKGVARGQNYITRGMELSVDEPSFIDMRNAILQADVVAGKKDHRRLWETFAARGMGASASAADGADTAPVAAFDLPPGLPASDLLGPVVTIDSPSPEGVVRAERAVFSGTAVDDAGITGFTVNGVSVPVGDGATWSATLRLPGGRRNVEVLARDIEDRSAAASRTVLVDVSKPKITRVKVRRRNSRLLVSGTSRDDIGGGTARIGRKKVPVSRGGMFFLALPRSKARTLKIVLTDRAGRRTRKSVKIR